MLMKEQSMLVMAKKKMIAERDIGLLEMNAKVVERMIEIQEAIDYLNLRIEDELWGAYPDGDV